MTTAANFLTIGDDKPPIPPGVLRGPADADHYRVKVGRYGDRWYVDPLPACELAPATDASWPSVTSVKNASGKDWTFVGLKRVAVELRDRPTCLDGLDYDDCYERLKAINKSGLRKAQQRGTNVHTYLEMGLRGHGVHHVTDDREPGAEYLPVVRSFFDTYAPKLVAAEVVCIHRTLNGVGYGGTADGIIEIDGKYYWVDWKTRALDSSHGAYAEEAGQIGAGATAEYMLVEGLDGPMRQRIPEVEGGLVVSIKPDGVKMYPIDIDAAAKHWASLHSWWCDKRSENSAIGKPWAPRKALDPIAEALSVAKSAERLQEIWVEHRAGWTAEHTELAKQRKAALS